MKKRVEIKTYEEARYITDDGEEYFNEFEAVRHEALQKAHSIPNFSFADIDGDFYLVKNQSDLDVLNAAHQYKTSIPSNEFPRLVSSWEDGYGEWNLTVVSDEEVSALKEIVAML